MPASDPDDTAGLAALAICESLLLALHDRKILPEREIAGILRDAAMVHEVATDNEQGERHAAVVALINGIRIGSTSARRR